MSRILCFASSDRPELYEPFHQSFRDYCERWNMTYKMFPVNTEHGRAASWNKIYTLNRLFEENEYDVFWWVDDDMVLTNPDFDVRKVLDEYPTAPILVQKDIDTGKHLFNCGTMLIRNCLEAKIAIRAVWDNADAYYCEHANWEQDIMIRLYHAGVIRQYVQLLEWRKIQSFLRVTYWTPEELVWRRGDFIAHITGEKTPARLEIFGKLKAFLEAA